MSTAAAQTGFTLVELLVGLALAGIILLPLTDMLRAGSDSARAVRSSLDAQADARFALDRIAARAASATGATPPPPPHAGAAEIARAWLAPLQYTLEGRDLVETDSGVKPARISRIATNVTGLQLEAPLAEPGWRPVLRIALTLDPVATGCAPYCTQERTLRLGPNP